MLRVLLALVMLVEGHVSFVVRDVTGTRQLLRLKVGHAENGMFTRSLTVRIPNGVLSAKAVTLGGWTVSTTMRPLGGLSFSNGHNAVTEAKLLIQSPGPTRTSATRMLTTGN